MTNYEKIKNMSIDDMAKAIYGGISSDPCDYCICNKNHCHGFYCVEGDDLDVIVEWLKSEVEK